jgi:hypothetical protein
MSPEHKNYLIKSFIQPTFLFFSINSFIRAILKKIERSFFLKNPLLDFPVIAKHRSDFLINKEKIINIKIHEFSKSYNLVTSIGSLKIGSQADWHKKFDDPELNESFNRWNWLLSDQPNKLSIFSADDAIFLIKSWSYEFLNSESLAKKEPYSIGERISNTIIFFNTNDYLIPDDILIILNKLSVQLIKYLEYYPNNLTGNHAFNNARALYLVSNIIENKEIKALAFEIIKERIPILITEDGFMREGSSHYHFLFTRWTLEIFFFSEKFNDKEIKEYLSPYIKKLLKQCWFFLVNNNKKWSIPLFGDVSPDFTPNWLISLPWSKVAMSVYKPTQIPNPPQNIGWSKLFGNLIKPNALVNNFVLYYSSSCGWHRTNFHDFSLFIYNPKKENHITASHAHLDLCSFVLYYKGKALIIDIGRLDYTNSQISKYGKSIDAHNSLLINKMGPEVELLSWMSSKYTDYETRIKTLNKKDKFIITINHNGFKRIVNKQIKHERVFILSKNSIEILDKINGKGNAEIINFFNFAPGYKKLKYLENKINLSQDINFEIDNNSYLLNKLQLQEKKYSNLFHPEYGSKIPIISIEIKSECELPICLSNKITIK